jgi:hypothetical protein
VLGLNGNWQVDFADVVLYFNRMDRIREHEPVPALGMSPRSSASPESVNQKRSRRGRMIGSS